MDIAEKIRGELKGLIEDYVVLVSSPPDKYPSTSLALLRVLVNEIGHTALYISVNKPYATLMKILSKEGIATEKLYFIDCATGLTGSAPPSTERCDYLNGPNDLTSLSLAISRMLTSPPIKESVKECFLFLDSVSTFLIYNDPNTVARFLHMIISKARENGVKGVIFSLRRDVENVGAITSITQFCDKTINIEES